MCLEETDYRILGIVQKNKIESGIHCMDIAEIYNRMYNDSRIFIEIEKRTEKLRQKGFLYTPELAPHSSFYRIIDQPALLRKLAELAQSNYIAIRNDS